MTKQIKDKVKIAIAFLLLMVVIVALVNGNKKEEMYQTQQVQEVHKVKM